MKKSFTILSLAALLFSCTSGPEKSVKNFTENLSKGKVEEAKKYATETTGKILDLASGMGVIPVDPDFRFEVLNDSIVGNRAWITIANPNRKIEIVQVIKIDGDWLVHMEPKY
ncbi:hypothetical protein [Algoriphagus aquimarinus]|uniref:hypothetical protein n=1 Tax=Algoriphagus aquimarinus TaxID=237018 RepID=UPI0030DCABF8|tara:strand:+ start:274 stop:612 length:339 start_codon:yes stop_codon:yes gene_type:complete